MKIESKKWTLILILTFLGGASLIVGVEAETDTPWGIFVDPTNSCEIEGSENKIVITVPGGNYDLVAGTNQDAPRALRPVRGDFRAVAKISGAFDPGQKSAHGGSAFNGGGFLIWGSDRHYLRFERDVWKWEGSDAANSFLPLVQYWRPDGSRGAVGHNTIDEYQVEGIWFEVSRSGNQFSLKARHDKAEWIEVGSVELEFPESVQVGFSVVNTSAKPCMVSFESISLQHSE